MTLRERTERLIKECTDVAYDHLAIRCDFAEKIEALILDEVAQATNSIKEKLIRRWHDLKGQRFALRDLTSCFHDEAKP